MQSKSQDHIKCKFCQQRLHISQMYAHHLECNISNHPNYQSQIQSEVNQNQSQFQHSNISKQSNNIQQSSQRQPVNYVESTIYNQQQGSKINLNQPKNGSNYPLQNNTQEIQRKDSDIRNVYTESLLKSAQKKCEYCDQEYPTEQLDLHYPKCEAKQIIEQEQQLSQDQNEINDEEPFNYYNHNNIPQNFPQHSNQQQQQYQYDNSNEIYQNQQPYNLQSNISTTTTQELQPDGSIKIIKITRNRTGQIISQQISISRPQQQQQNNNFLIFSNSTRNNNQRNIFDNNFLNNLFNNNPFFGSQRSGRFFSIPMFNFFDQRRQSNLELDNLAVIKFAPYDGLSQEYKQCSICITNYEDGEELILLPCIHRFHKTCISEWFKEQSTCPICKTDVTQQEMPFEEDDLE